MRPEDLGNILLEVNNIEVVYKDIIQVLRGVSLKVPEGQITALLGPNGAGKTTTLRAISGLLVPEDGKVVSGSILYRGENIANKPPEQIVLKGIVQVPEGRRVFKHLTVEENLRVGAVTRRDGAKVREDLERIYHYFPKLALIRTRLAGYCSGGEQQMLAIGRALLANPKDGSKITAWLRGRSTANLDKCEKGWCRLKAEGSHGWARESEIWGAAPAIQCKH
ncbi:MAG: ATP-binding cassette domain-containing protein [Meiothermus ruber]|uniref:ATP-binding cassette domain-containing protein n=1 Tax=Meiothermus ruber TaxID=277 RepID=UPI0023F6DCF5|nr:ATP-binding cassette domain-containing protein [Meiothermus ruber]MCL6529714.1 ATP-binding cassette domain-containing protein [Meiothermus ruber]